MNLASVRHCTHPQRTRRQEQAEKLRKARAKRTDQQQLAELDKVFGKGKGAKKERARLKERIKKHDKSKLLLSGIMQFDIHPRWR